MPPTIAQPAIFLDGIPNNKLNNQIRGFNQIVEVSYLQIRYCRRVLLNHRQLDYNFTHFDTITGQCTRKDFIHNPLKSRNGVEMFRRRSQSSGYTGSAMILHGSADSYGASFTQIYSYLSAESYADQGRSSS